MTSSCLTCSPSSYNKVLYFDRFTSLMSFRQSATFSGSSTGFQAHPDSTQDASHQKSFYKKRYQHRRQFVNQGQPVIEIGKGSSNYKLNLKALDPLLVRTVSRAENGDRIEFRNRGTKLNYRNTYEQDGSLRESHKIGFPHFVIIRNFKKVNRK